MNKEFIDNLVEQLEESMSSVSVCEQSDILDYISDSDYKNGYDCFPMICFESTEDTDFTVDVEESKFLYDPTHRGTWIIGNDGYGITFILCLKDIDSTLCIDALEVNKDMRGQGVGRNVLDTIESTAESYYKSIQTSPFDTNAQEFWEHMSYVEDKNGYWSKKL